MNPVTTTGGRQHHAVPLGTMCVFELPWGEQVDRGRPVGRDGGRGLLMLFSRFTESWHSHGYVFLDRGALRDSSQLPLWAHTGPNMSKPVQI